MILVTGGLGFVGSHTGRALLDMDEDCVLVGRDPGRPPEFLAGATIERMDCTDLESVLAVGTRHEITGIVHLAAAGMGGAPLDELWTNTQAFFTMVRAAQAWGVRRMVMASTIGVYGGVTDDVYREDAPLPIASAHAIPAFKKSAETLAGALDIEIVSARIGAVWGPLGRVRSRFFAAPQMIHAAARGEAIEVRADDAIDMLYTKDCGRAIASLQTADGLRHTTYNVGSGRSTANRDVAAVLGSAVTPGGVAAPPMDVTRLSEDTGFAPAWDLTRAVADYLAWLQDHER